MVTATPIAAEELRARLVDQLVADGELTDPAWREAFAAIPREVFVPYFFLPCQGRPGWRLVETDEDWLRGAYVDDALVTQMNGDEDAVRVARSGGALEGRPTSSSSAPSLMAAMLHALDVRDGMKVLEIGTGTGYNAALVSHRLGDDRVTTVEVDPTLAMRARAALDVTGHAPTVIVGDGTAGHLPNAPYDRVIATVAFDAVPASWLTQTHDGARIVVPLRFAGSGGLMALLRRDKPHSASGRFLDRYGGFMAVRSGAQPDLPTIRPSVLTDSRPTTVPAAALSDAHPAAFYLSMCCPHPYRTVGFTPDDDGTGPQTWGGGTDGSMFALVTGLDGTTTVSADGALWEKIEAAYGQWIELDRPARDRFGITVTGTTQWVWMDDPGTVITELAPERSRT